jgi:hypothetical protein
MIAEVVRPADERDVTIGTCRPPPRRQSVRDPITASILLRLPRSERSAQVEALDMQEVTHPAEPRLNTNVEVNR